MDWISLMEFFEWKLIDFQIFCFPFYSFSSVASFFLYLHHLNILHRPSKSFKTQIFGIFSKEGIENFFKMYSSFDAWRVLCSSSSHVSDCTKSFSSCSKFHEVNWCSLFVSYFWFYKIALIWLSPFWFLDSFKSNLWDLSESLFRLLVVGYEILRNMSRRR